MMKTTTTIAAALIAAMLTGCGTTPAGIVIVPAGKFGTMMAGPGKKRPYPHQGVDYRKPKGSPVLAPADGTVVRATHLRMPKGGWKRWTCGNGVEIKHTGIAEGLQTAYCHLGKVHVNYGDTVRRGQVIGTIGTCASGPPVCSFHPAFRSDAAGAIRTIRPADEGRRVLRARRRDTHARTAVDLPGQVLIRRTRSKRMTHRFDPAPPSCLRYRARAHSGNDTAQHSLHGRDRPEITV